MVLQGIPSAWILSNTGFGFSSLLVFYFVDPFAFNLWCQSFSFRWILLSTVGLLVNDMQIIVSCLSSLFHRQTMRLIYWLYSSLVLSKFMGLAIPFMLYVLKSWFILLALCLLPCVPNASRLNEPKGSGTQKFGCAEGAIPSRGKLTSLVVGFLRGIRSSRTPQYVRVMKKIAQDRVRWSGRTKTIWCSNAVLGPSIPVLKVTPT